MNFEGFPSQQPGVMSASSVPPPVDPVAMAGINLLSFQPLPLEAAQRSTAQTSMSQSGQPTQGQTITNDNLDMSVACIDTGPAESPAKDTSPVKGKAKMKEKTARKRKANDLGSSVKPNEVEKLDSSKKFVTRKLYRRVRTFPAGQRLEELRERADGVVLPWLSRQRVR